MSNINKPWGYEEILETNEKYTVKKLVMYSGHKCSLQYHNEKKETIYVLSGLLTVYINDSIKLLTAGQFLTINPKIIHRMEAKSGESIYLECSTSQLDDVVRINDDYGR